MDSKTKIKLSKISKSLESSKKKIKAYQDKLSKKPILKKEKELKLRIEIEKLKMEIKKREVKLIELDN